MTRQRIHVSFRYGIQPPVINAKTIITRFFLTYTTGEAQGLNEGRMMPCRNISVIFSIIILLSGADTRYGTQLIGRPFSVSMACSAMFVYPKFPSAVEKHRRRIVIRARTALLFSVDKFSPIRPSSKAFQLCC
jgi:hypothetical protein